MEVCELCKRTARIRCESDQATLCWDCDARVHSANFLVARHSRNLLCHVCQSPTPWVAAGAKLETAVLICEHCAVGSGSGGGEESAGEGVESESVGVVVVLEENQVVRWSPPPAVESSSTSCSCESVRGVEAAVSRKRCRKESTAPNPNSFVDRGRSVRSPGPPSVSTAVEKDTTIAMRGALSKRKTSAGEEGVCGSPQMLDLLARFQGGEMAESCTFSGPSI